MAGINGVPRNIWRRSLCRLEKSCPQRWHSESCLHSDRKIFAQTSILFENLYQICCEPIIAKDFRVETEEINRIKKEPEHRQYTNTNNKKQKYNRRNNYKNKKNSHQAGNRNGDWKQKVNCQIKNRYEDKESQYQNDQQCFIDLAEGTTSTGNGEFQSGTHEICVESEQCPTPLHRHYGSENDWNCVNSSNPGYSASTTVTNEAEEKGSNPGYSASTTVTNESEEKGSNPGYSASTTVTSESEEKGSKNEFIKIGKRSFKNYLTTFIHGKLGISKFSFFTLGNRF